MATGATLGLATLTAANAVWMAEAYAGVMDSVAQLANPTAENVNEMIADSLKTLGTYGGIQIGSAWGITHDEHTPRDEQGQSYFPKTLTINNGQGALFDTNDLSDEDTDDKGLSPASGLMDNDDSTAHISPPL